MLLTEEATAEYYGVQGDEDGSNVSSVEYVFILYSAVAVDTREGIGTRIVQT
jgi:hypothetical protein